MIRSTVLNYIIQQKKLRGKFVPTLCSSEGWQNTNKKNQFRIKLDSGLFLSPKYNIHYGDDKFRLINLNLSYD